jgi:hypothetical protein
VTRGRRLAFLAALVTALAACSSSHSGRGGANAAAPPPPTLVTAKAVGGSSGTGPLVVPAPPSNGGPPAPEHVQLAGRAFVLEGVATSGTGPIVIRLDVAIDNTGTTPLRNDATFFTLLSREGDTFGQVSASAGFYGMLAAGSERRGTVVFQVPAAAAAGLRLLYRPDVATDSVLVDLPAG